MEKVISIRGTRVFGGTSIVLLVLYTSLSYWQQSKTHPQGIFKPHDKGDKG